MSWLARSLVNSLRGDTNGGDRDPPYGSASADRPDHSSPATGEGRSEDDPLSPTRGVKEDITELTKTISRQFWGVASFLAPPPTTNVTSPDSSPSGGSRRVDPSDPVADEGEVVVSPRIAGIRSDFAELGGRFRSGISMLSSTKAVSEISKIASTFLPFGEDETEEEDGQPGSGGGVVGVTEDVLLFVRNISMHPETWLDFPLIAEDEDSDDFEMSDAQQEHALAVERFEPRLAALRIELCPSHMSEGCFWKIYFVLLHSRLNKYDAELLSTPQIVQARALLLQDLRSRKPITDESARSSSSVSSSEKQEQHDQAVPSEGTVTVMPISGITSENLPSTAQPAEGSSLSIPVMDIETEKFPVETTELKIVDKPVIEEGPTLKAKSKDLHTDAASIYEDDWLEDEIGEVSGSGENNVPLGNDEDVSFSDLEEDDDHGIGAESKVTSKSTMTQVKESRGWVQLNSSSGSAEKRSGSKILQNKDGNDWLNVDEVDVE